MDLTKLLTRRNLSCFHYARASFSTRPWATKPNLNRLPTIKSSKLNATSFTGQLLPGSSQVRWCSGETDSKRGPPSASESDDAVEVQAKEEVPLIVNGSPRLEVNTEESDNSVATEETSDENPRLDKLYKVIELEVLAYEPSVLDSYQWFVVTAATHLGITVGKCWSPLKSDKMRFALLKSAFVHKKHQVQYEVRTHHRFITLHKLTSSTADTFLEYIERNLPEGVGLKVTRVEAKPLPEFLLNQKQAQQ